MVGACLRARAPKSSPGCGLCPKAPAGDSTPKIPGPPQRPRCPRFAGGQHRVCAQARPSPVLSLLVGVSAGTLPPRVPCTSQFGPCGLVLCVLRPGVLTPGSLGPAVIVNTVRGGFSGCRAALCCVTPHRLWPVCLTAHRGLQVPCAGAACHQGPCGLGWAGPRWRSRFLWRMVRFLVSRCFVLHNWA